MPTVQELGIDRWSVAERLALVEQIWDTIPSNADPAPLTAAQQQDLARRIADFEAHPLDGSTWDDVKARVRRRV